MLPPHHTTRCRTFRLHGLHLLPTFVPTASRMTGCDIHALWTGWTLLPPFSLPVGVVPLGAYSAPTDIARTGSPFSWTGSEPCIQTVTFPNSCVTVVGRGLLTHTTTRAGTYLPTHLLPHHYELYHTGFTPHLRIVDVDYPRTPALYHDFTPGRWPDFHRHTTYITVCSPFAFRRIIPPVAAYPFTTHAYRAGYAATLPPPPSHPRYRWNSCSHPPYPSPG